MIWYKYIDTTTTTATTSTQVNLTNWELIDSSKLRLNWALHSLQFLIWSLSNLFFFLTEVSQTDCPQKNKNYGQGDGLEEEDDIQSWEECSDLCYKRSECQYWTWHHGGAGEYSHRCHTMKTVGVEYENFNCVSGTSACTGASEGKGCNQNKNRYM